MSQSSDLCELLPQGFQVNKKDMQKRNFSLYAGISIFSRKGWVSNGRKIHVEVFSAPRHRWLD